MKAVFLAVLLTAVFPSARAAERGMVYATIVEWGLGNKPCSEFVAAVESQPHNVYVQVEGQSYPTLSHAYLQWLAGYLTAYSRATTCAQHLRGLRNS